jgi:hypothetical protein
LKAEKHLIQLGQKDPQHWGHILDVLVQKGTGASSQLKQLLPCKPIGKELHLTTGL